MDFTEIFLLVGQTFHLVDTHLQRILRSSSVLRGHQRLPQAGNPLVSLPLVLTAEVPGGVAAGVGDGEPVVLEDKIISIKYQTLSGADDSVDINMLIL